MFKKSNRNFRTKKAEFDSNDESETVTISVLNKNRKPLVSNTVLSFENELNEDDTLLDRLVYNHLVLLVHASCELHESL